MNQAETQLKHLLERSRLKLTRPFSNVQRRLIYVINVTYLLLTPIYLISEKMATGLYVPDNRLWFVYGFVGLANLVSGIFAFVTLKTNHVTILGKRLDSSKLRSDSRIEQTLRWTSLVSVMCLSVVNTMGIGNPSRVTFGKLGYTYRFNYLTPVESVRYEKELDQHQAWALKRQAVLRANHLNPPQASRYFNTWIIFIGVATATAYFFAGVALDLFKIIPEVTDDIKDAIEATKVAEERRLLQQQETLSTELKALKAQVNPHFLYNTLNYFYIRSQEVDPELADSIIKLSEIMRYSMREDFTTAPLSEEINYMKQFISLHQLRYPICMNFTVTGDVDSKTILPFILIGLVENAFKHG
ncbi:MAG: histidine kinase, partial [Cytophagaceae bacterium]